MMNTYQKLLTGAVVVLVLINIVLLGIVWNKSNRKVTDRFGESRGYRMNRFFENELKLDSDQMNRFVQLQKDHQRKMKNFSKETRQLNRQLHRAIVNQEVENEKTIDRKMDSLHQLVKEENFEHIRSMTQICRPDQKEKLLEVLDKLPDRRGFKGQEGHPRGEKK